MNYTALTLCISVSLFISLFLPFVLLLSWRSIKRVNLFPAFIGAVTFVIFAMILEQGCHSAVLQIPGFAGNKVLYVLYAGLAAGVFEEVGRYLSLRFVLKNQAQRDTAVTYGIGHGGIEAILLHSFAMLNNLMAVMILSKEGIDGMTATFGLESAEAIVDNFSSTSPGIFLVGGIERIVALVLHIALSVIVFRAVKEKKIVYLPIAILLHTAVDCFSALYTVGVLNVLAAEVGVTIITAAIAVYAVRCWRAMPPSEPELPAVKPKSVYAYDEDDEDDEDYE